MAASRDNECDRHNHSVHSVPVYEPVLWPEVNHHKSEEPRKLVVVPPQNIPSLVPNAKLFAVLVP